MKRLRIIFAIPVLCLFLPLWRYMDMLVIFWPQPKFYGFVFFLLTLLFIALPVRLIRPKSHWGFILGIPLLLGLLLANLRPLSNMTTSRPDLGHCGSLTYTGVFYPIRSVLSDAHQDDLEIRNQLCWVRKMIVRVLPKFDSEIEYMTYTKLTREKLLRPVRKYSVALPLISFLYGSIINRWDNYNISLMKNIHTGQLLVDEMKFWTVAYTEEVSSRDYGWWDWLHGNYIKWEYGFIERNWHDLIGGFSTN